MLENYDSIRRRPEAEDGLVPVSASALVWSSDYPTVPGMYWIRYTGQKREIAQLRGDLGNLKMRFYGEFTGLHNLPKRMRFEWAGPIPEPQEPND